MVSIQPHKSIAHIHTGAEGLVATMHLAVLLVHFLDAIRVPAWIRARLPMFESLLMHGGAGWAWGEASGAL